MLILLFVDMLVFVCLCLCLYFFVLCLFFCYCIYFAIILAWLWMLALMLQHLDIFLRMCFSSQYFSSCTCSLLMFYGMLNHVYVT